MARLIASLLDKAGGISNGDILAELNDCTLRELCQYWAELLNRRQSVRAVFGHANSSFIDLESPGNQEYSTLVRLTDLVKVAISRKQHEIPVATAGASAEAQANKHDKTTEETPAQPSIPVKPRYRRGPRPDYATAGRVASIVEQFAGTTNWRSKLDEICWELDEKRIARPKPWKRKGYTDWIACLSAERQLAVKAIEHHLKLAKQYRETIS